MYKVITDAQYKKDEVTGENDIVHCKLNGIECSVPLDENNSDYIEILRQVKEGTLTIKDAD
jgi:hypothetical protein